MVLGYIDSSRLYGLQIPEMEKVRDMNYHDSNNYVAFEFIMFLVAIGIITGVLGLLIYGISKIISRICGND